MNENDETNKQKSPEEGERMNSSDDFSIIDTVKSTGSFTHAPFNFLSDGETTLVAEKPYD